MKRVQQLVSFELLTLLVLMAILASQNVMAASHRLLTITNDETKDVVKFILNEDKNKDITSFRQVVLDQTGKAVTDKTYKIEQAAHGKHLTLMKKKKYEVVNIKVDDDFANHNGGHLILDYLHDGRKSDIKKKRASLSLELARAGKGWEVLNSEGNAVSQLHFKSKKVAFFGTVGIDRIITK
jgi:glucan biosynthesis protein